MVAIVKGMLLLVTMLALVHLWDVTVVLDQIFEVSLRLKQIILYEICY